MGSEREVLHVAVGSEACRFSAHLFNLQGLAATSENAQCVADVTHATHEGLYVPRAVFIDHPSTFDRPTSSEIPLQNQINTDAWDGPVERIESRETLPVDDAFSRFFQDASTLAYGSHSRYRKPEREKSVSYASQSRHVNWDDEDMGEEGDEIETSNKELEEEQRKQDWYNKSYLPTQSRLDSYWSPDPSSPRPPIQTNKNEVHVDASQPERPWTDYLLPPFKPTSCLSLPTTVNSIQDWDTFNRGLAAYSSAWKEDKLFDSIRRALEVCDACQGIFLGISSTGWAAGMGALLLQELSDECPAAYRLAVSFESNAETKRVNDKNHDWHTRNVLRVRNQVERGLSQYQLRENAHAIVPLEFHGDESSRLSAVAMESVLLPYRLKAQADAVTGLSSSHFYGSFTGEYSFGTASSLSFRELVKQNRPTPAHCMLEIDLKHPSTLSEAKLATFVQQGTSVERDHRMRHPDSNYGRPELPGKWIQDSEGWLNLSPHSREAHAFEDRSKNLHFSLSASIRSSSSLSLTNNQLVTCMMESIGPRFRPEQSSATVLRQDLLSMTAGGYGAGSYWNQTWQDDKSEEVSPVVALLGNTSRRYSHLNETATKMKEALSPKLRGFYTRDLMEGSLPELDDCEEAIANCWDLRDVYMPPDGSGLVDD